MKLIDRDVMAKAGYDFREESVRSAENFLAAMCRLWRATDYAITLEQVEKEMGVRNGEAMGSYRMLSDLGLVGMAPGMIGKGRYALQTIKIKESSLFWAT